MFFPYLQIYVYILVITPPIVKNLKKRMLAPDTIKEAQFFLYALIIGIQASPNTHKKMKRNKKPTLFKYM